MFSSKFAYTWVLSPVPSIGSATLFSNNGNWKIMNYAWDETILLYGLWMRGRFQKVCVLNVECLLSFSSAYSNHSVHFYKKKTFVVRQCYLHLCFPSTVVFIHLEKKNYFQNYLYHFLKLVSQVCLSKKFNLISKDLRKKSVPNTWVITAMYLAVVP